MSDHDVHETHSSGDADSHVDAFAAVALILIVVLTAVFWVSQQ